METKDLRPGPAWLYIETELPATKVGTIEIPEVVQDQQQPHLGVVLAVGSQVAEFHEGDLVVFHHWSATLVKVNGRSRGFLPPEMVLGYVPAA